MLGANMAVSLIGVLVLAVLGVLVAGAVVAVVLVVRRSRDTGAGPLERIHRDYRQLTLAERHALLEFIQSDLAERP
jgi:hypothetical protein